jgi:protein-disulfide isomerase
MSFKKIIMTLATLGLIVSCNSDKGLKDKVGKILIENPDILAKAIEANPADFMQAVQKAAKNAQKGMAKKREEDEKRKMAEAIDKPLQPVLRDEAVRGTKGAPLVLVEYSDFQCPFCTRGFDTVLKLMKKYPGKIQFIYKHLPLSFHQQAMLASQYYEAIFLQSPKKAFAFHDELFANQPKIKMGNSYLKKVAKKLKVDMKKLAKDVNSEKVKKRIAEDQAEAAKFGMQGTPGFLINGVPVKGAYPAEYFEGIIAQLKAKGKVKL